MSLLQYIRKRRGGRAIKAGVMVAKEVKGKDKNGKVLVGWSKCKLSVDTFDPELGIQIAEDRIKSRLEKDKDRKKAKIPHSIRADLDEFVKRCKRYFQTKEVKVVKVANNRPHTQD